MLTGADYLASLTDGRVTFFEGEEVKNIPEHPVMGTAAQLTASTYDRFHNPDPGAVNLLMTPPRSPGDLRDLIPVLSDADIVTRVTFGSLMALLTAADRLAEVGAGHVDAILAYHEQAKKADIRITECITDAKGDRTRSPQKQADPDAYVHVVSRQDDGVVIRGAKLHITGASYGHDLMVMPTKRMGLEAADYSIACAVPVNTPGVTIINSSYAPRGEDVRHFPHTSHDHMPDGFVVFDDVFVPRERIFLDGDPRYAAVFAHSLGLWERIGGVSQMTRNAELLVGFAHLIADANGLLGVAHVKDKLAEMIIHATMLRAGLEAALHNAVVTPQGFVHPNELYTNAAKYQGAANYSVMVRHLHDIAGGSLLTAPTIGDLENPATAEYVKKYMQGRQGIPAENRLKVFHAIRDHTADAYGGWHAATNVLSGGGLFAQRIVASNHFDIEAARELALADAGIEEWNA
jgi:4-hydroxybutyryl-CoA dehydratase / vinylacetyl-CoA-Delta-isomerase